MDEQPATPVVAATSVSVTIEVPPLAFNAVGMRQVVNDPIHPQDLPSKE